MSEGIENEVVDYKLLGLTRITSKPKMNPAHTNTKVVAVALSQSLLDTINTLTRAKYPNERRARSKFLREMIERGIKEEAEGGNL